MIRRHCASRADRCDTKYAGSGMVDANALLSTVCLSTVEFYSSHTSSSSSSSPSPSSPSCSSSSSTLYSSHLTRGSSSSSATAPSDPAKISGRSSARTNVNLEHLVAIVVSPAYVTFEHPLTLRNTSFEQYSAIF